MTDAGKRAPASDLDQPRFDELAARTLAALDVYAEHARRLAGVEVDGRSPDGRVRVRVTAGGSVRVRLRADTLRRYSSAALSETVTSVLRDAQKRARETYERKLSALEPPELAECQQILEDITRE